MKLWELIKAATEGAYVQGDLFKDSNGNMIYFDGKELNGIEFVSLKATIEYVGWK